MTRQKYRDKAKIPSRGREKFPSGNLLVTESLLPSSAHELEFFASEAINYKKARIRFADVAYSDTRN
ncbi:hypothetical protein EPO56_02140 [Patescibacteria group bacterium]|nr:MAG: hypothetical protein EPO56_02140 [Patescibacteria group bacterium]